MKRVLIDIERRTLHDVVDEGQEFPVVEPLSWVDASDDISSSWSWDGQRLVQPVARSLDVLREERWEYLKDRRRQALDSGIEWNGHRWDSKPDDMVRIATRSITWRNATQLPDELKARLPGPIPKTVSWTTEDNIEVPLTLDDLTLLDAAMAIHTEIQFGTAKALRVALAAASTAQEIAKVDWP